MKSRPTSSVLVFAGVLVVVGSWAVIAQDKYSLRVPEGLAFSEFKGGRNVAAGRQRVKHAAVVSAWSVESIVRWVPAVSTTTTVRACLRQTDSREERPGSRPAGENSVSCPR
jgi:hypothetical protein